MKQRTSKSSRTHRDEVKHRPNPFRHDFIQHALDRQRSYKPEEIYIPQGDFDSLTSYNKEYTGERQPWILSAFIPSLAFL